MTDNEAMREIVKELGGFVIRPEKGVTPSEIASLLREHHALNNALEEFLKGELSIDDYFDILVSYGKDPDEYLDHFALALEYHTKLKLDNDFS